MIVPMLELSTAHITENTARWIDEARTDKENELIIYNREDETGWFIWVPDSIPAGLPHDLKTIIEYALMHKCHWICLDEDALTMTELVSYEW